MIRYRPGQIKKFLYTYDWNVLFQELATVLIGIGVGMYCYEKKVGFLGKFSGGAVGESDYPLATIGMVIIGVALLIKVLLYASVFDANSLKSGKIKIDRYRGLDVNGILQEISTVLLGFAIGLFTTPVVKNSIIFEKSEYPDPTPGIVLAIACLLFKALLYSKTIDCRKGRFWHSGRIKPFLGKYNWNEFFQEFTSTMIGVGIGLFLYQSGIAFLPAQFFKGTFIEKTGEKTTNVIEKVFGEKGKALTGKIRPLWSNERAKPYMVLGIVIISICALIKVAIYASLWDANHLRNSLVGSGSRAKERKRVDTSGMADEIATLLLTAVVGIMTAPVAKNALMDDKEPYYGTLLWGIVLVILAWIKLALIAGALEIGRRSRSRH